MTTNHRNPALPLQNAESMYSRMTKRINGDESRRRRGPQDNRGYWDADETLESYLG